MKANDIGFTTVDTLGMLLAQIAELTKQADAIKDKCALLALLITLCVIMGMMDK